MFNWERPRLCESAGERSSNAGGLVSNERITDFLQVYKQAGGNALAIAVEIAVAESDWKFDKKANEDLETHTRRGVEAFFDWKQRRELGMKPKNERDDPKSQYSLKNIEEGMLMRETKGGVEFGVLYDKHGELISIQRGDKGSVGNFSGEVKQGNARDGLMTHSHPSDGTDREYGHTLSAGDISGHGQKGTFESRAVAREGVYSIKGNNATIPKEDLAKLPSQLRTAYLSGDRWEKNQIACKVLSERMKVEYSKVLADGKQYFAPQNVDHTKGVYTFFNSEKAVVLMGLKTKELASQYGLKYEFKARDGFESVGKVINSGSIDTYLKDTTLRLRDNGNSAPHWGGSGKSPVDAKGNYSTATKAKVTDLPTPKKPASPAPPITIKGKTYSTPKFKKDKKPSVLSPLRFTVIK